MIKETKPLTYLIVSAVKTFSPTAMRFSNLRSLGNVLAIHSFWSMNWGDIRFGDAQTNQFLPETHTGSIEALGLFLGPKRGVRQKEPRKREGRREWQAMGGSQPTVPTCSIAPTWISPCFTCRKSPPTLRWSCEILQQRAPVITWRRHLDPFVPVRWKFTWSELTIGIEGSVYCCNCFYLGSAS